MEELWLPTGSGNSASVSGMILTMGSAGLSRFGGVNLGPELEYNRGNDSRPHSGSKLGCLAGIATEVSRDGSSLGCDVTEVWMEVSLAVEWSLTTFCGSVSSAGDKDTSLGGGGSISSVASWHCCRFRNFSRLNFVVEILKTCN